jgi:hypothetical protein
MQATIADAAGPDDNYTPLGIGDDPACYSAMRKTTDDSRKRQQSASETLGVVAILDGGDRRVITDAGGVQWILQKRTATGSWSNHSYCRTKEALIRCFCGSTPELDALPDRIGDRVAPTTDTQEAAE